MSLAQVKRSVSDPPIFLQPYDETRNMQRCRLIVSQLFLPVLTTAFWLEESLLRRVARLCQPCEAFDAELP